VFTYDGDTPTDARKAIREKSHVVLTNPDMLHNRDSAAPHALGRVLFENLALQSWWMNCTTYRGVFGSHLCNVLRRLQRIATIFMAASRNSFAVRQRLRIRESWLRG